MKTFFLVLILFISNFAYADANDEFSRVLAAFIEDNTIPVTSLETVVQELRKGKVINPVSEKESNNKIASELM